LPVVPEEEHAEGIVVAQVLLDGKGELRDVAQLLQVAGMHAARLEGLAVVRHLVVGPLQGGLQALQLERGDLVAAGGFDGLELAGRRALDGHGKFSSDLGGCCVQAGATGLPLSV
jgi:hypothetical protein